MMEYSEATCYLQMICERALKVEWQLSGTNAANKTPQGSDSWNIISSGPTLAPPSLQKKPQSKQGLKSQLPSWGLRLPRIT